MSAGPVTQSESVIDAIQASRAGAKVHLKEQLDGLPRLREAGAGSESYVEVEGQFSSLEDAPTFAGELSGELVVPCQRCMQPMRVELDEPLEIVLVASEADLAGDFGSYEPVLADLQRFDLRWFLEEQALLAMPLVARHEDEKACAVVLAPEDSEHKKPFANLRDLLKKQ
jgi:uncharacterized protein